MKDQAEQPLLKMQMLRCHWALGQKSCDFKMFGRTPKDTVGGFIVAWAEDHRFLAESCPHLGHGSDWCRDATNFFFFLVGDGAVLLGCGDGSPPCGKTGCARGFVTFDLLQRQQVRSDGGITEPRG